MTVAAVHFYFPLAACVLVSLVATIVVNLFSRR
jgi:hypothetical protein